MEAQDPLWRGGGRGWFDHCLFERELDVSCRFGFRRGGGFWNWEGRGLAIFLRLSMERMDASLSSSSFSLLRDW